jgi:hypothetical protein
MLELANQGLLRIDFQREVSRMIMDFSGCDAVELWLKGHDKYFRCRANRHPESSLPFEITPCLQNENGEIIPGTLSSPTLIFLNRVSKETEVSG